MMPKPLQNGPSCSFLPKLSGNMPAGQGRKRDIPGVTNPTAQKPIMAIVIVNTSMNARTSIQANLLQWEIILPIILDCMTCTAMYGSGVRIIGTAITMEHLMMVVSGWTKVRVLTGSCAVARGSSRPRSAGRRPAAGTPPSTGMTLTGSGLSAFQVSNVNQTSQARGMLSAVWVHEPHHRAHKNIS